MSLSNLEKNLQIALLLDYYGGLLTPKQRDLVDLYYNEDLSLGEIAEQENITRQAVRDSIKRGEQALTEFENTLGFAGRSAKLLKVAAALEKAAEKAEATGKAAAAEKATATEKAEAVGKAEATEKATAAEKAAAVGKGAAAEKAAVAEKTAVGKAEAAEKATTPEQVTSAADDTDTPVRRAMLKAAADIRKILEE